jgi:acetyl-CoA carboxylase beta subunit
MGCLWHKWQYSADLNKWVCIKCGATKEIDAKERDNKPKDKEAPRDYRKRCHRFKKSRARIKKELTRMTKKKEHQSAREHRKGIRESGQHKKGNRGHNIRGHK